MIWVQSLNGATPLMFEGLLSYPHYGRFREIVEKHKINRFYTAPTVIRALTKQNLEHIEIPFATPTKLLMPPYPSRVYNRSFWMMRVMRYQGIRSTEKNSDQ